MRVRVRTGSKEGTLVGGVEEDVVVMNVRARPRDGRANAELVKRLSKLLGVSQSRVTIVSGHRSREKTLRVRGMTPEEVYRAILGHTGD